MKTLSTKTLKAKKQHTCNYCGLPIPVGEIYERQANIYDGIFYEWKSHHSCNRIARELDMFNWCDEGVTEEDFKEFIHDEYSRIMSEKHDEEWESKEYKIPPFEEILRFVKNEHSIQ